MRNNCQTADPVRLGEQYIKYVTELTYLGAKVTEYGNTEDEIKTRINKARGALVVLTNIWKKKVISKKTKIRMFKTKVLSVLLYAAELLKEHATCCNYSKTSALEESCTTFDQTKYPMRSSTSELICSPSR